MYENTSDKGEHIGEVLDYFETHLESQKSKTTRCLYTLITVLVVCALMCHLHKEHQEAKLG